MIAESVFACCSTVLAALVPSPAALPLAHALSAPAPRASPDSGLARGLECRIHRSESVDGTPRVEVTVNIPADPDGTTELRLTSEWGGVSGAEQELHELAALTPSGDPLPLEAIDDTHWRVEHESEVASRVERIELRYVFPANEHQSSMDPSTYRRVVVNERVFHAVGEFCLVTPEHVDADEPAAHTIEWTGFGESAGLACSFGVGPGPHTPEVSLNQLRHSIFLGGDVTVLERDVWGSPLYMAVQNHPWAFDLEEFAELAASIVDFERSFFEDFDKPFYLISMIPVGAAQPGSLSFGGTGLTTSFSLAVQPGFDLELGGFGYGKMTSLLTHELFHDWNGIILQRVQPEQLCYWFSEGFTEFYTRRIQLRAGMFGLEDYVDALNASLQEYYSSPVCEAANEEILEGFWTNEFLQKLPYRRGDVVAMILDHALRSHSGGERNLDDLMRELVARGAEGWRISTDEFLDIVAEETDSETAAALRAIIVDGERPVLDSETFAPCLKLEMIEVPRYDPGFDVDGSMAAGSVLGVREDGPAWAAGLRDGTTLRSWSYARGDASQPVVFQVEDEEGNVQDVSFRPVSGAVLAPQFRLADEAGCDFL